MSELLFECYGAPSVCYGVDALFSYYYNKKRLPSEGSDGLIISSGNLSTHHLLIADHKLDGSAVKR
jgi:actin-related protein 5